MPSIRVESADGNEQELSVAAGTSVMQALVGAGHDGVIGECGGQLMCATCHVYVESAPAELPEMTDDENEMLGMAVSERLPNSRLSCQLRMRPELDGLCVRTPEEQI